MSSLKLRKDRRARASRSLRVERLESREVFAGVCDLPVTTPTTTTDAAAAKANASALVDDRFEENDTFATAANLGAVAGTTTVGSLVQADANDWYKFTTSGRSTSANSVRLTFTHAQGDLDVELYNASGALLGRSQGTTNSEALSLANRAAGTYYVRVYGYRGATNPTYSLTLNTPGTTTPVTDDAFEDNDTLATAKDLGALTTLKSQTGLVMADANDYFKFSMAGAGTTSDYVAINLQNAQGDLDLELYNSAGQRVGISNGTGGREQISLNGLAAGTYSVRVYGYNGARNPSYSLEIDPGTATTPTPNPNPNPNPTPGGYDIQIQYAGLTASQQAIFEQAAARWERVITGDLANATYNGVTVDDLLINASSVSIDGVNGVLGQAGPDRFRSGSMLPYHGTMQFDSADLAAMEANGTLLGVVAHEIGHVLGIGTLWDSKGLLVGAGTSNVRFTGAQATAAYNAIFGRSETGVPVESDGGSGTADAHWDETLFGSELMTGYVGPSSTMPLSRITVGSLADIGYTVNMAAADAYSPTAALASSVTTTSTSSSNTSRIQTLHAALSQSLSDNLRELRRRQGVIDSIFSQWI